MGRAELEALLAGTEDGDATPGDLARRLRALGVRVGTGEADEPTSADAPSPGFKTPVSMTPKTPGLDTMLSHMNADQLKAVAKRFQPSANASRVVESKKAVMQALGKPALLGELVGKLNPLERALLSEVKRRGGVADGWALIVYAALQGFRPVERAGAGSVYKSYLGSAPGMAYLGVLLRDGLLIPEGSGASRFASVHFYGSPDMDALFVDPRVLAQLPDEPRLAPPPLELEPVPGVTPTASHPLRTPLELYDVLHLLVAEGGLQLTQRGTVGKPLLSRLHKRRPHLEGRLERLLRLALALGLLNAPESGSTRDPWRVDRPRLHHFQTAPLRVSYSLMVEAYLNVAEPDESWGPRYTGLVSEAVAAEALLQSLALLPKAPVAMAAALAALWERALKHVGSPRRYGQDEPERPAWFTGALLGAFRDLGLVAVAELPDAEPPAVDPSTDRPGGVHIMRGDKLYRYRGPSEGDDAYRYALMPAPGLSWFAEGQRWRRAAPNLELGLEPETGGPVEPSLLIQPNFDILVYLDKLGPPAILALSCADCRRVDAQTASYTLSRSSLYRALESGLDLATLLGLLNAHSMGVPENVARSLTDWASRRERLRVREKVTLLEYSGQKERDAALDALKGARAVAERFLLLTTPPRADSNMVEVSVQHRYGSAPARTLRFSAEGHIRVEGTTDLAGRAVLAQLATQGPKGTYRLNVAAIRAGALTTTARDALTARARGGLPPQLGALLTIWAGGDAPAVAKVSIFQHASVAALAKHPGLAPYLGAQLNDTSYLVKAGQEAGLEEALLKLGVNVTQDFTPGVEARVVGGSAVQSGLDTRKMRALIETTIAEGRSLELRYHREKELYDGLGYGKKTKGKLVTEKIIPSEVVYSGSTPYLSGETLGGREHRHLRIGYITGITVL